MTAADATLRAIRRIPPVALAGGAMLIVVIMVASFLLIGRAGHPSRYGAARTNSVTEGRIKVALPPPDLYRPLSPEQAIAENAKRAPTARRDTPAAAFNTKAANDEARTRALDCLTQAIYYEAASEPADGQRAVAQVVLNRVRHPAYPASVCGVVYQGSERVTGCQFSFTCDGSLRRVPATILWQRARAVATAALGGKVFGPAGHATHYHADYVVPYWADSLDKELQIGHHIFYRLRGGLGTRRAFDQRYRGREPSPLTPTDIAVIEDALGTPADAAADGSTLGPLIESAPVAVRPTNPLPADLAHGQLLVDETHGNLLAPLSRRAPAIEESKSPCPSVAAPLATRTVASNNRIGGAPANDCR